MLSPKMMPLAGSLTLAYSSEKRCKLHLVVNEQGELLNVQITPGNTDDRKPVPGLLQSLFGKVFADRPPLSRREPPRSFDAGAMFLNPWLNSYFKNKALSFLLLLVAT